MSLADIMRKNKYTLAIGRGYRKMQTDAMNLRFSIGAFFRSKKIGIDRFKKLENLKGKYEGKRCFIIATGPSLTTEDILKLKNEYTFSMNAMCLKYDSLGWCPDFYGIQDEKVFNAVKTNIDSGKVKYIFVDEYYRKDSCASEDWIYFPRNSVYNSYDAYIKGIYKAKFSDNPVAVVYDGFTIVYSLIQIAVYMGFKEIYLLGCDCNYSEDPSKRYFVDHGVRDKTYKEAGNRMIACYPVAKEYADKNGIKIFNATRGGMLEVFERVDLDTVLLKGQTDE